tara:strand:- start:49248 stop:49874 length:627 start_codon:yes stop_codon:yes gene_type:complete
MRIGIDFDNTIVCYDQIFHAAAAERELIPAETPKSKQAVRDYLRRSGKEAEWIELQGYVYGVKLAEAEAFPGLTEFIKEFAKLKIPVSIISHKTRTPYAGPAYDLHRSAENWIKARPDISSNITNFSFQETKIEKLQRIQSSRCTHFVDDLSEFLTEPGFPPDVKRLLFDPDNCNHDHPKYVRLNSWKDISKNLQRAIINEANALNES